MEEKKLALQCDELDNVATIFANGGGVCNNGYIGRSKSPMGPFERWCGDGWGEHRVTAEGELHWLGKPAPVIYYDEDWHHWGAGEFSFVIKDETIYIYYTWTSRHNDGKTFSQTRVATADITDENWPAHLTYHGVASERTSTSNDSYDVVYCEDLSKFVALSTDHRFREHSILAVYESDDGLRFQRVNEIKVNTGWKLHNCGISGDIHHHIKKGDTMLLAYAYGSQWGKWATRLHRYDFEGMDEAFYSETNAQNVHLDPTPWQAPDTYEPTVLYLRKPHFMRVQVGTSAPIPMMTGNVTYDMKPANGHIEFSNYDKAVLDISEGCVHAKTKGYSYVTATMGKLTCEFLVYVTEEASVSYDPMPPYPEKRPYPDKCVTSFVPVIDTYEVVLAEEVCKQIRGIATYADGLWFELAGNADGVTYVSHNTDLLAMGEDGCTLPTGKVGETTVTVSCGGFSFDVTVKICGHK